MDHSVKRIDFFIVGGQKCSSTFLHHALMIHPSIFMPENEISIFQERHFSEVKVEKLLSGFPDVKYWGIKRPVYLYSSNTADLLYKHNPNAKIIIVVRDPAERSISAYSFLFANGFLPPIDINDGMRKILSAEKSQDWPIAYTVLLHSLYSSNIEYYLNKFGKNNVFIIDQRELINAPQKNVDKIYTNLGLEPVSISDLIDKPLQKVVYDTRAATLLNRAAQIESICNQVGIVLQKRRKLSLWRKMLASYLRNMAYKQANLWRKPHIDDSLAKELQIFFKEEYNWLEKHLNMHFS